MTVGQAYWSIAHEFFYYFPLLRKLSMYIKIHSEAFKNTYLSGFKCLTAFEHEEWLQECNHSNMVFNAL